MKRTWTPEQISFLTDNYGKLSHAEIARHIGKTSGQVKSQASNLKITVSRKWPQERLDTLIALYSDHRSIDIAEKLGISLSQVHAQANNLGLKKSKAFCESPLSGRLSRFHDDGRGAKTRFTKGHESWNKGTKGVTGIQDGCRGTQFKKGQQPRNHRPVGSERVNVDGYVEIKTQEPRTWELKQRVVWRQHFGEIPRNHVISFKDKNPLNVDPDNLECVSKEDWMRRNTLHNYPPEIKGIIYQLSGMKRRLKRYAEK